MRKINVFLKAVFETRAAFNVLSAKSFYFEDEM